MEGNTSLGATPLTGLTIDDADTAIALPRSETDVTTLVVQMVPLFIGDYYVFPESAFLKL